MNPMSIEESIRKILDSGPEEGVLVTAAKPADPGINDHGASFWKPGGCQTIF
jgi:hypothetical protein